MDSEAKLLIIDSNINKHMQEFLFYYQGESTPLSKVLERECTMHGRNTILNSFSVVFFFFIQIINFSMY